MKKQLKARLVPHIRNGRFYNHEYDVPENFFLHTLPAFARSLIGRKKRLSCSLDQWVHPATFDDVSSKLLITWLGHATFLIQMNNFNVITDPIFTSASLLFPRIFPEVLEIGQLPKIHFVLISHNHRDHMDIPSLRWIEKNNPEVIYLVPQGDKKLLLKAGLLKVQEYSWWEQETFTQGESSIICSFLPSHHWSARGFFDKNKSLWGSWMIQSSENCLYFAGDTAYWQHFTHIAQEFPKIQIALMPIAPTSPSPSMQKTHMNVEQSVQAFIDLQAQSFIPMHWGTFAFGIDTFHGPISTLKKQWEVSNFSHEKTLYIPKVGQQLSF